MIDDVLIVRERQSVWRAQLVRRAVAARRQAAELIRTARVESGLGEPDEAPALRLPPLHLGRPDRPASVTEAPPSAARSGPSALRTTASGTDRDDLAREVDGLRSALRSRAPIEQAKGIVMAQCGCDADEAFRILSRASQRTNRKVRDLAEQLVADVQRRQRSPLVPPGRPGPPTPRWSGTPRPLERAGDA